MSLGSCLRELRAQRGVSLDEVARATRIAVRYLTALEADDLGSLPPPAFTRGFIRAYCQVLQSPPEEALLLYHRQTGTPVPIPAGAERRLDLEARSRGTVLLSFVLLVVLGLALVAVTLVLQSGRQPGGERQPRQAAEPSSAPSPTAPVLDVPPAAAPAPEPRRPQPAAASQSSAAPVAPDVTPQSGPAEPPYRLVARVSEPTWVRVRMDEGRSTEETIPAGEVREWVSTTPFVLTVGNAGGITLELNGRPLPPLGARGAVISRLVVPSLPQ
jgi:cytoskeletal protein RodZ